MKLSIVLLCLCLVLTQATPFDLLRQQAVRATKLASDPAAAAAAPTDASLSFLEKQQELAFEMEKEDSSKHSIAEADAVDNLAQAEVQEAAQQAQTQQAQTQQQGQQQQQEQQQTTTTQTTQTTTETQEQQQQQQTTTTEKASANTEEKKADKPMQWEDAVLVEDLTKERASADANTKFIGANMKSTRVGTLKEPRQNQNQQQQQPKPTSFLQMGAPLYYYPVHPAFLQQQQRLYQQHHQQQQTTEGRSAEGAKAQGWGDYGTPLYWAEQYGSYDGLGAAGANMYGNFGYAPYASGYDPAYTQAAGGASMVGASPYYNPYAGGGYGTPFNIPAPPPVPTDLPLPPYVQPAQQRG